MAFELSSNQISLFGIAILETALNNSTSIMLENDLLFMVNEIEDVFTESAVALPLDTSQ